MDGEIDSVLAKVGAEKLWAAILARLGKAFPNRDYYNRSLDNIGDYTAPDFWNEFTDMAANLFTRATTAYNARIAKRYSNYQGFIKDLDEEEDQIIDGQKDACENDDVVIEFKEKLQEITDWLQTKEEEEEG